MMSNLFERIVNKENMDISYSQCMLGKTKYKKDAILFDKNVTYNKQKLLTELIDGTYTPSAYHEFYVSEPKRRHIFAPAFRDKLVQRMVYNVLKDIYFSKFIQDTYACIENRGTHSASYRTQHFLRKAKWLYGDSAYIIKLDIKKFFYSINKFKLKSIIRQKITCQRTLHLLYTIVDSLSGETGVPLGNITSHTFANIIASKLDNYCKRWLGLKFYIRYMDDICIIVPNKNKAKEVLQNCNQFLTSKLSLVLNEKKTKIFPLAQGVNFVGFKTYVTHKLLRDQSKKKIKRKIKKMPNLIESGKMTIHKAEQMLNSWLGHSKHGNNYNFIKRLLNRFKYIKFYNNKLLYVKEE